MMQWSCNQNTPGRMEDAEEYYHKPLADDDGPAMAIMSYTTRMTQAESCPGVAMAILHGQDLTLVNTRHGLMI